VIRSAKRLTETGLETAVLARERSPVGPYGMRDETFHLSDTGIGADVLMSVAEGRERQAP
jgi:hypothetical protein